MHTWWTLSFLTSRFCLAFLSASSACLRASSAESLGFSFTYSRCTALTTCNSIALR